MDIKQSLVNRLKEVLTEGKWVTGTNFKQEISNINWKDAIKSVNGLNSIAGLTFHIHYYIKGVNQVFEGGPLDINDKYSFYSPPINIENDWIDLVNRFCNDSEKFIKLVSELPEEKFSTTFVDEKYGDYQRNINVMIEHCYYHLGQIIIIKKLINK